MVVEAIPAGLTRVAGWIKAGVPKVVVDVIDEGEIVVFAMIVGVPNVVVEAIEDGEMVIRVLIVGVPKLSVEVMLEGDTVTAPTVMVGIPRVRVEAMLLGETVTPPTRMVGVPNVSVEAMPSGEMVAGMALTSQRMMSLGLVAPFRKRIFWTMDHDGRRPLMVVPTGLPEESTARMNKGPIPGPGKVKTPLPLLVVRMIQALVSLLKMSTVQLGIGVSDPFMVVPVTTAFTLESPTDLIGRDDASNPV